MKCFLFHKWAKWSEPRAIIKKTTYLYGYIEKRRVQGQSRTCDKCGKMQLREISGE